MPGSSPPALEPPCCITGVSQEQAGRSRTGTIPQRRKERAGKQVRSLLCTFLATCVYQVEVWVWLPRVSSWRAERGVPWRGGIIIIETSLAPQIPAWLGNVRARGCLAHLGLPGPEPWTVVPKLRLICDFGPRSECDPSIRSECFEHWFSSLKWMWQDVPGSPKVASNVRDGDSTPGQGIEISHAVWPG